MSDRKYGGFIVNPQQMMQLPIPGISQGYGGNYNSGSPFPVQSYDQRRAELEALGAQNTGGDLPYSPRLKSRKDGSIHIWNQVLAMQPALFVNCDEEGNEEPTAWYGRKPKSWGSGNEPSLKQLHRVRMTKQGMAHVKSEAEEYKDMGLSSDFLPDFSHGTTQAVNPFGGNENGV